MKKQLALIFCAVLVACSMQMSKAAIISVANLNDAGTGSLRWAIGVAVSGDTINFSVTGTIYFSAYSEIIWNKSLTIQGPGPSQLILDGRDSTYMFHLNGGLNRVSGIAFVNGRGTNNGGCIDAPPGPIADSIILENCNFRKSYSSTRSGAINSSNGRYLVMRQCIVDSCISGHIGGGITTISGAMLENTTFSNCSSVSSGGAAWLNNRGAIVNCTFANNHSNSFGGAISIWGVGNISLLNNTFSGNSASLGDVIYVYAMGPGLQIDFQNNIFHSPVNNFYSNGSFYPVTQSNGGNISSDTSMVAFLTAANDLNNTDPLLDTAGLQHHGGPVKTIALTAGSPAIDNGILASAPLLDQRGYSRNGLPDAGAFEYNGVLAGIPGLNAAHQISIYPNPAKDQLIIRTEKNSKESEFTLYNTLGEKVTSLRLETGITTLDVSFLAPAIYFYSLTENGLVKQSGKVYIE